MTRRLVLFFLFLAVAVGIAETVNDIASNPRCDYCGMSRQRFAHSRVLITYEDGTVSALCSMHCAAIDLDANKNKTVKSIQVADYKTKKLIDAKTAVWVVGGNQPGVMTARAKWAFEKQQDADAFMKQDGGSVSSYDVAMKAANEDMQNGGGMGMGMGGMRCMMAGGANAGMRRGSTQGMNGARGCCRRGQQANRGMTCCRGMGSGASN